MPTYHWHVAAEWPFVHAGVLLHPAEPLGHDSWVQTVCFFMIEIEALQKCSRSCDSEHFTLEVYTFPSDGRGIRI